MPRANRLLTNAEQIALHVARHGGENIIIHEIPRSPFWLIASTTGNGWKIYVCNPQSTVHRLVTPKATTEEYTELWAMLIVQSVAKATLTKTAQALKKCVHKYYKKKKH